MNKSSMSQEDRYVAIVSPESGNPDLYLFGYDYSRADRWRKVRESRTEGKEENYVIYSDLEPNESHVYFSIYGTTEAAFKIEIFKEKIAFGGKWHVSESGVKTWRLLGSSSVDIEDLRFGDFVGDSKTDVFMISDGYSCD